MSKNMKILTIDDGMAQKIIDFCKDELSWHNDECEADEYIGESEAEIFLLRELGETEEADYWEERLNECLEEKKAEGKRLKKAAKKALEEVSNDDYILGYIEEDDNLRDFVGFDCFEDTDGYDLRRAWGEAEEYVENLSSEDKKALADGLRKSPDDYFCCDMKVHKRIVPTEAEKAEWRQNLYNTLTFLATERNEFQPKKKDSLETLLRSFLYWADEHNDGYFSEKDEANTDRYCAWLVQQQMIREV